MTTRGRWRDRESIRTAAFTLLAPALLTLCATAAWASPHDSTTPAEPVPAARIPVGPLGFLAPNPSYLNMRLAWASLDFIDDDHLLFTFHVNGLLPRLPGDPSTDDDQEIHADVLDIATGRVLQQASWRMHDRGRYLWALQDGRFLVRVRNALFLTDRTLKLTPYLKFDSDLQAVEVSPDRGLLLVEVQKALPASGKAADATAAPSLEAPTGVAAQTRTEIVLLRPGDRTALADGETQSPVEVPLVENGYLGVKQGLSPDQWVIDETMVGKGSKPETAVATIKSSCPPKVQPLGGGVVLTEGCLSNGSDRRPVSALQLKGGVLWRALWQSRYIWPELAFDKNGSRFAYESLLMDRDIGTMDAFGEVDVVAQPVGVFDTRTDKPELVIDASPVLSEGQNFALSPDGRRFAVLRDGALEVFDLPAPQAK